MVVLSVIIIALMSLKLKADLAKNNNVHRLPGYIMVTPIADNGINKKAGFIVVKDSQQVNTLHVCALRDGAILKR
jgi:hypothetical protein